jgi:arylsulfatase
MFSSDNGPWYQGSPGTLRGRKGETYEGGMREPFIARMPGAIPAGRVVNSVASTMDILPTVARLAQAPLPSNPLDGIDIWPLLTGDTDAIDRNLFLYFNGWNVQCARSGKWKLHLSRYNAAVWSPDPGCGRLNLPLTNPELYDLEADPEESYDVSRNNPQIVADIRARVEEAIPTFPGDVQDAWRNTMSMQVQGTPTGALPVWRGQQ